MPLASAPAVAPASVFSAVAAQAFATAPAAQPEVPPAALPQAAPEPEPATASGEIASGEGAPYSNAAAAVPDGAMSFEIMADDTDMVGGVACPVDPMERLQCESCQ